MKMSDYSFADVCEFGKPDDFFLLSSRLYKNADHLSLDARMELLPVLENIVMKFEDCAVLKTIIRSIRRFIDDEIIPYRGVYLKELQYTAYLDDDDDFLNQEDGDFRDDDEYMVEDDVDAPDDLFVSPMRKGSPLRFDGLSIVAEGDSEEDG